MNWETWFINDSEDGQYIGVIRNGDLYALITSDMETGSGLNFHAIVRFPIDGDWERLDLDEGMALFRSAASGVPLSSTRSDGIRQLD